MRRIFGSRLMRFGLISYGAYQLVLKPSFNLGEAMYCHWLRPRLDFQQRYGSDSWALITGASNGIGEAYAQELAQQGFNLILLGRSPENLAITQANLIKKYPKIKVTSECFDLTNKNVRAYEQLTNKICQDRDVAVLVNNAGAKSEGKFEDETLESLERVIATNTGPYVYLTRFVAPKMLARDHRSAIIFTCQSPNPETHRGSATYRAAKAFDNSFAESFAYESITEKIDVLVVKPGKTTTKMFGKEGPRGLSVVTAGEVASSALDKLGQQKVTAGSWKHAVKDTVDRFVNKWRSSIPQEVKETEPYKNLQKNVKEMKEKLSGN